MSHLSIGAAILTILGCAAGAIRMGQGSPGRPQIVPKPPPIAAPESVIRLTNQAGALHVAPLSGTAAKTIGSRVYTLRVLVVRPVR